jgi:hypothetical protein
MNVSAEGALREQNVGVGLVGGAAGGAHQVQLGVLFCLVEGCVALDGSGDGVG